MVNPFQAMKVMQNPMNFLQQQMMEKFKNQNPQKFNQIQQMVNGKNEQQLKEMAQNIAKERGIDLNQFASQFGIKM
jgi:rRNA processing protein Krr1/Pno1